MAGAEIYFGNEESEKALVEFCHEGQKEKNKK